MRGFGGGSSSAPLPARFACVPPRTLRAGGAAGCAALAFTLRVPLPKPKNGLLPFGSSSCANPQHSRPRCVVRRVMQGRCPCTTHSGRGTAAFTLARSVRTSSASGARLDPNNEASGFGAFELASSAASCTSCTGQFVQHEAQTL